MHNLAGLCILALYLHPNCCRTMARIRANGGFLAKICPFGSENVAVVVWLLSAGSPAAESELWESELWSSSHANQTSDSLVGFLRPAAGASPQFLFQCAGLALLLKADSVLSSVHRPRPNRILPFVQFWRNGTRPLAIHESIVRGVTCIRAAISVLVIYPRDIGASKGIRNHPEPPTSFRRRLRRGVIVRASACAWTLGRH
jgi:hypothetical protein